MYKKEPVFTKNQPIVSNQTEYEVCLNIFLIDESD